MHLRFYASLALLAGTDAIDLEISGPTDVRNVLSQAIAEYPQLLGINIAGHENVSRSVLVMVNKRSIEFLDGLATLVNPEDVLYLFPPIGGG